MNIPFSPPFVDQEVIDEVVESLTSGWITSGPKVKALEIELAKFTSASHAVCVNSWTSGAILVMKWFGVKPGDEVIIPAYTYSATALAVLHCGAKPVMVDINDDLTINVNHLRNVINPRTKIIMPVDIAGLPCDYDAINSLVQNPDISKLFQAESEKQQLLNRILVISDAAHSFGAQYKDRQAGVLTDITIFSFHAVKNLTTAEGGGICLNLPEPFNNGAEYSLMKLYSLNGQNKDALAKSKAGSWKYDILFQGLKANMPDLCAAVGLAQIRKYDDHLLFERARVAYAYQKFFISKGWAQLPILDDENRRSCYHLYALRIHGITELQRDQMIEEISKTGISVNVHFIPMPMLTLFKELGYQIANYPNSYDQYSREISLPIYPQLSDEDILRVCNAVESAYLSVTVHDEASV